MSQAISKEPSAWTGISAMFLVAGTCIGGGMLALPVPTGVSGFIPSIVMMLICWSAMTSTGLLLAEASLWLGEGAHIISMSSKFLGRWGEVVSWILYLFICYASLVAYTAGGGAQIGSALEYFSEFSISKLASCTIFILFFGFIVDFGAQVAGRINSILFFGLIISYFCIIGLGVQEIHIEYLSRKNWGVSFMSIPLLLTSFSFQTMVPSLTPYLKRNAKWLRWSIVGGTSIACFVYLVWECFILGIVPAEGANSLAEALQRGEPATNFIRQSTQGLWIALFAEFFSFFAIITSFLGIALGLFDFMSDGLKIKKKGFGKLVLGMLIIVPTLFFAVYCEQAFLVAMDASGGFGDTILSGIIPVLMVWIGRYRQGMDSRNGLPGGKFVLAAIFLFFLFSFILESLVHLGYISSIYDVKDINLL